MGYTLSEAWSVHDYSGANSPARVICKANKEWSPCHVIHAGARCDVISTCVTTTTFGH
jgi:hypothetical protein